MQKMKILCCSHSIISQARMILISVVCERLSLDESSTQTSGFSLLGNPVSLSLPSNDKPQQTTPHRVLSLSTFLGIRPQCGN